MVPPLPQVVVPRALSAKGYQSTIHFSFQPACRAKAVHPMTLKMPLVTRSATQDQQNGSACGPVIVPVFKTGGRRAIPSPVGSTPTRFRHFLANVYAGLALSYH